MVGVGSGVGGRVAVGVGRRVGVAVGLAVAVTVGVGATAGAAGVGVMRSGEAVRLDGLGGPSSPHDAATATASTDAARTAGKRIDNLKSPASSASSSCGRPARLSGSRKLSTDGRDWEAAAPEGGRALHSSALRQLPGHQPLADE